MIATPRSVGIDYEDAFLTTSDGVLIHGWFVPHENAASAVLWLHGNAGNISGRVDELRGWHDAGFSIFILDYRGFGISAGKPSEPGLLADAEAALDYLIGRSGNEKTVVFGQSLGGTVAAQLAEKRSDDVAALILEATFTSVRAMAFRSFPVPGIGRVFRSRYDALSAVSRLTMPKLIIHGTRDTTVPFRMGRVIAAKAAPPVEFFAVEGAGHNLLGQTAGEAYFDRIAEFIARAVSGSE
jgi:pimeloyl-ACP methyl ester carboxylesterase